MSNADDLCPGTPAGETVDANGCSASQLDDDSDGVSNADDLCPGTPVGEAVDANGCSQSQLDDDGDGVTNDIDLCPGTPAGEAVDANGCSQSQLDDDGDGVSNDIDLCPGTPAGEAVDANGCSQSQLDDDGDGVSNADDNCSVHNPIQQDRNNDGQGDACDPVIVSITAPVEPVDINNMPVIVGGTFIDGDDDDTHTATWDWGDTTASDGTVDQETNSVSGSHVYAVPGVYMVKLTVSDNYPASDEDIYEFVVIYDPAGGFVTGGGWIWSPEGACPRCPSSPVAKANFGFVSKYKKGASTPTGQTQFQFKAGDLNFHSNSYEWLVIAGANAKYKGVGTINGEGEYGFMLTATDGDLLGGGKADEFRIRIWDDNGLYYDNKSNLGDDEYGGTELSGGNIVIHKK